MCSLTLGRTENVPIYTAHNSPYKWLPVEYNIIGRLCALVGHNNYYSLAKLCEMRE